MQKLVEPSKLHVLTPEFGLQTPLDCWWNPQN